MKESLGVIIPLVLIIIVLGWLDWRKHNSPLGYQTRASRGLPRVARWPYGDPAKKLPGENRGSNSPEPPPVKGPKI